MNEILITTVISSICTGGITWLFTLKYTRKQAEADAMLSVQNVYQQIIEDLKTDRVELKDNIKELALKVSENEREIKAMKPNLCGRKACTQRIPINYSMRKYALYIVLLGAFFASCSRSTIAHRKTNETMSSDSVTVRKTGENSRINSRDIVPNAILAPAKKTVSSLSLIQRSRQRKKPAYHLSKKSPLPVSPLIRRRKLIRRSTSRKT
jgi:hypothetical protein